MVSLKSSPWPKYTPTWQRNFVSDIGIGHWRKNPLVHLAWQWDYLKNVRNVEVLSFVGIVVVARVEEMPKETFLKPFFGS